MEHWLERAEDAGHALQQLAADTQWHAARGRTLAAARAIYLRLPSEYKLWKLGKDFSPAQADHLRALFAAS